MSDQIDSREMLKKMAQLSITTNQINEIQQKNLKMYPFVFFNGVKSVSIEYDLTNQSKVNYDTDPKTMEIVYKFDKPMVDNFKVAYDLKIDETQDNSHMEKRFDALEKSIATLFWNGIPLEVKFNGKEVYKSKKNV